MKQDKFCLVGNSRHHIIYVPNEASHFTLCYIFILHISRYNEKKLSMNLPCFRSFLFFKLYMCFKTAFNLFPKFFKDLYRDIKCLATSCCTRRFFSHITQQQKPFIRWKDGFLVFFFSSAKFSLVRSLTFWKKDGCCFLLKSVYS